MIKISEEWFTLKAGQAREKSLKFQRQERQDDARKRKVEQKRVQREVTATRRRKVEVAECLQREETARKRIEFLERRQRATINDYYFSLGKELETIRFRMVKARA
jgi:hypothetical protein